MFAEGDSRVLMMKVARDRVRWFAGSRREGDPRPRGRGAEAEALAKLARRIEREKRAGRGAAAWEAAWEEAYAPPAAADAIVDRGWGRESSEARTRRGAFPPRGCERPFYGRDGALRGGGGVVYTKYFRKYFRRFVFAKSFPPGLMTPGGGKQPCFVSKLSRRLLDVRTITQSASPPRALAAARWPLGEDGVAAAPRRSGARTRTRPPSAKSVASPLLGFRAAEPGPSPSSVPSVRRGLGVHGAPSSRTSARAPSASAGTLARFPRARRASPSFSRASLAARLPSPATSEPGVEDAVAALRSLAQVEEVPAPRTAARRRARVQS